MRTNTSLLLSFLLAACGGGGDAPPDAAGPDVPLLAGNFSCARQPRPSTVADPLPLNGKVSQWNVSSNTIAGATVEIHSIEDDSLIGQTTTAASPMSTKGGYRYDLATGGTPRGIYRKFSAAGFIDIYAIDPWPQFVDWSWPTSMLTQSDLDDLYTMAGLSPDHATSAVLVQVADCFPPSDPRIHYIEGAVVDAPPGAKVIYSTPNTPFFDPSLTATASDGYALVVGIQPGAVDLTIHAGPITYRPWSFNLPANVLAASPRHP